MYKGGGEGRFRTTREEEAAVGTEGLVNHYGRYDMFLCPCWCRSMGMAGTTYGIKIGNGN